MSRPGPSYNSMSWVDTAALFRITMPATRRIFCKCIESKWYYESCFVFWLRYHIFKYPIAIQGDQKPKAGQCTFWNRLPENLQVTSFYKHGGVLIRKATCLPKGSVKTQQGGAWGRRRRRGGVTLIFGAEVLKGRVIPIISMSINSVVFVIITSAWKGVGWPESARNV